MSLKVLQRRKEFLGQYSSQNKRMKRRRRFQYFVMTPLFLLLSFCSSCSTIDERDECCESLIVDYRYSRGSRDEFTRYIHKMTHLIFDKRGILYVQYNGNPNRLQRLELVDFPAGRFTLVSIGNRGDRTDLSVLENGKTNLSDVLLRLSGKRVDGFRGNGDDIYWGIKEIESKEKERHRYLCDMSNIHCRLTVTVRWRDESPGGQAPYTLQLSGVPGEYILDPAISYKIGVVGNSISNTSDPKNVIHCFPFVNEKEKIDHRIDAPFLAGRIRVTFTTLRYTDGCIPFFSLSRNEKLLMKEIDLSRSLKKWNWKISNNIEQDYAINVEILGDGTVIVTPDDGATILDWIDGGSI